MKQAFAISAAAFAMCLVALMPGCRDNTPTVDHELHSGSIFMTLDGRRVIFRYDGVLLHEYLDWSLSDSLPLPPKQYLTVALEAVEGLSQIRGWRATSYQVRRPSPRDPFVVWVLLQVDGNEALLAQIPVTLSGMALPHDVEEKTAEPARADNAG
jgi:hypothetical protein